MRCRFHVKWVETSYKPREKTFNFSSSLGVYTICIWFADLSFVTFIEHKLNFEIKKAVVLKLILKFFVLIALGALSNLDLCFLGNETILAFGNYWRISIINPWQYVLPEMKNIAQDLDYPVHESQKQSIVDVKRKISVQNPLWSTRLVQLQVKCLQLYIKLNLSQYTMWHLKHASGNCQTTIQISLCEYQEYPWNKPSHNTAWALGD